MKHKNTNMMQTQEKRSFKQMFEDFLKPIWKLIKLTDTLISGSEKLSNNPLNNKSLWVIGLARSRISDIESLLIISTFSDVHVRSMTFKYVQCFLVLFRFVQVRLVHFKDYTSFDYSILAPDKF